MLCALVDKRIAYCAPRCRISVLDGNLDVQIPIFSPYLNNLRVRGVVIDVYPWSGEPLVSVPETVDAPRIKPGHRHGEGKHLAKRCREVASLNGPNRTRNRINHGGVGDDKVLPAIKRLTPLVPLLACVGMLGVDKKQVRDESRPRVVSPCQSSRISLKKPLIPIRYGGFYDLPIGIWGQRTRRDVRNPFILKVPLGKKALRVQRKEVSVVTERWVQRDSEAACVW